MKRIVLGLIVATALALGTAGTAAADPTCSNFGFENHGDHVRDYVEAGVVAGGAPAHRGSGVQPGASFCVEASQSRPVQYP